MTECMGPAPSGPAGATVVADFDHTDPTVEVDVGTVVTYQCDNGVSKYAICDGNGEWWYENIETCETSGPNPAPHEAEPLPPQEGCMFVEPNMGTSIVVNETDCYFIKSHRKYSVDTYPTKKVSYEWIFETSPSCQTMSVKFEETFFGIDGDAATDCYIGDKLSIFDEKSKAMTLINICGLEVPRPLRIRRKNRAKVFQWRSFPTFGNEDGFLAYITVKGCEALAG